jgi:hypothetical protein
MEYFITLLITESHEAVPVTSQKNAASGSASVAVVKSVKEGYYHHRAFFWGVKFTGKL